ncbi:MULTISPECIES: hypothetical protein [unclassified Acinetobacter]|uniref:hypothetical protein n=1 Tax=unclassified Acinetobacter TaxID=196816 RepID=UPI001F4B2383|nr:MULTISPECIES: hypothetical protein [unclassified Acinetobacter]MCH7353833.1 hypothetical protein [Acinetobacter sp. NIPH 2023]MCH7361161.1 hypothetical protein [Acinetobacter sp. NIPH 2024]
MCDFELSEIIGLIQIAIGIIAIVLAILGYRKVLKQIDISNKQTNLTIAQVNSLNKERQADLKISLLSELNLQIKQLIEIKHNYEKLTIDLGNLLILLNTDPVKFANVMIYAELSGDFPLGDSRQPTYKSLRPFDLVS